MILSQRLMSLAVVVLLAGCSSSGTDVSAQQAAQFVPGTTTIADVTSRLGAPDHTMTYADGSVIYSYMHMKSSQSMLNYVPYVGMLAGGSNSSSNDVSFKFNPQGIYVSKTSSTLNNTRHSGFLNQN